MKRIALPWVVLAPLMDRLRKITTAVLGVALAESLTITPVTVEARMEPKPEPFVPSIVMLLVMVTAPKPPGSRQSISPPTAVFEIAPAKVLQGAVRLQGLTSSPTPDTQVRVACACVREANANMKIAIAKILIVNRNLFIWSLLFFC